jgi:putative tryptophan/tyrosine transport system substrate-binding protein
MRRRDFIKVIAGSAAAWPLAARAQQAAIPAVGFLNAGSPTERVNLVAAFRQALGEAGYVEGRNVSIEYRWAENQYDRLSALAADLVHRQVAAIATPGSTPAALAAKAATTTIPIIFGVGSDPVRLGLVASLSRPGGNVTGMSFLTTLLVAKQVELLHELVPSAEMIGLLVNPKFPDTEAMTRDAREAATARGKKLLVVTASTESDFNQAFATLVREPVGALIVPAEPFFLSQRKRIVEMADRHAVPAIYSLREFAVDGGLMSYGTSLVETYRQVGVYVGRILKGARPADLPVVQSTKFELVINLKAAKALGLQVPDKLLSLADEVIE